MMTMAEKTLLGLAIILSIAFAGMIILPAYSYEVSLVTSPNKNNFYVPAGKPFNITCRGSGDDAEKFSSLQWLNKEGNSIPKGIPGTKESQKNSLTLVFTNPKEEESGVYKCMAVYEKKQTLQKSVSIIFHGGKPSFDSTYQILTVTENSFLEILCTAEGESPINYEWYNQNENKITENSNSSIYVSQVANASVLTIPAVTMSDTGMYTCLARNRHGLSSKIFQLEVLSGDGNDTNGTGSFRGVRVSNVTARSVKFLFNLAGSVEKIEVLYTEIRNATEYYHTFNYGDNYEIKDLIPAGNYTFKFKAYPPSEKDEWSRPYRVVLLPEKPEVIFRTIDSGTVKLEWQFKFEDRMRKTIDRHEISYFTVQRLGMEERWQPSNCPITIRIPECTSASYTISGLSQKVYYEIQLRAHTNSGYSDPYTQKIYFP